MTEKKLEGGGLTVRVKNVPVVTEILEDKQRPKRDIQFVHITKFD